MKICMLRSDRSHVMPLAELLPQDSVDAVVLEKASIYRQLKELKKQNYDIFVNLCRGYREESAAAYSEVVQVLENLNLPHTGTGAMLYDTPQNEMKHIAFFAGVDTPGYTVVETLADIEKACLELSFPMVVKPLIGGDERVEGTRAALQIPPESPLQSRADLTKAATELLGKFDSLLIEEYIEGEEYSVLLVADPKNACAPIVYSPLERSSRQICRDPQLSRKLQTAAQQIFLEMNQGGYAVVNLSVDNEGEIWFSSANAPAAVFGSEPYVSDDILSQDQLGHAAFLQQIIEEGISRHQQRQKKYRVGKSTIATYGIFATQALKTGDVIIPGEARAQRIVTRAYVQSHWADAEHAPLLRYVYPLGKDLLVLRNSNPADWVLENHSCAPNTAYKGLDLIALEDIAIGEEMTVDFAALGGEAMEGFDCMCGAPQCRGAFEFARCIDENCIDEKHPFSLNRLQAEVLCR
jgi:D-alanine-D-alanine ligase-like ATP-grasp enzyme